MSATAAPSERGVAPAAPGARVVRLGAVSYLNSEPHVHGLLRDPGFRLEREVPSQVKAIQARWQVEAKATPLAQREQSPSQERRRSDSREQDDKQQGRVHVLAEHTLIQTEGREDQADLTTGDHADTDEQPVAG